MSYTPEEIEALAWWDRKVLELTHIIQPEGFWKHVDALAAIARKQAAELAEAREKIEVWKATVEVAQNNRKAAESRYEEARGQIAGLVKERDQLRDLWQAGLQVSGPFPIPEAAAKEGA